MPESHDVYALLAEITEIDEVLHNPDLRWYDVQLVDSLRTVEIMAALETKYGIEIAPTEIDREIWATPRHVVAFVHGRLTTVQA